MNPLKQIHTVELEGQSWPLRFELGDWASAERKLNIKLMPFGETPFWLEPGLHQNFVYLFVGLHRGMPTLTLDKLTDLVTWENAADVNATLEVALRDFFLRLASLGGVTKEAAELLYPPTPGPTSGPSAE